MEQNIVASQRGKIALLAVTIALVLTVSLVIIHNTDDSTATSYHDGDFVFIITDSDTASLVNYLGSGGTVVIPSVVTVDSIDYPVTVIDNSAFHSCARVESIVIPDGVNAINNYAFAGCTGLRMVNVPSTVTDIKQSAFEGCINLESITVDESNSNYKSVDGVLFSKDGKTLIVCPGGLTGDYVIPDGVETINSYAFYVCEKLNSVVIPEGIKSIDYKTFVSCLKMKSVSLPESLMAIKGFAFYDCEELTSVDIPDSVNSIGGYAFCYCYNLKTVHMPEDVVVIGSFAFYECGLESVTIPSKVETIGNETFYGCSNLKTVEISSSVITIGSYAFNNCKALESINVDPENENYKSIDGILFTKDGKTLITYPCNKAGEEYSIPSNVTVVEHCSFEDNNNLVTIRVHSGVEEIGVFAFGACDNLIDIIVDSENVGYKSVDGVLYTKDGKTLLQFPCGRTGFYQIIDGTTKIGVSAFEESKITKVIMPDSVETIDNYAFYMCYSLGRLDIPLSVTNIGEEVFYGVCHSENAAPGEGVGHGFETSTSLNSEEHKSVCSCGYVWIGNHYVEDDVCIVCGYQPSSDGANNSNVAIISAAVVIVVVIAAVALFMRRQ